MRSLRKNQAVRHGGVAAKPVTISALCLVAVGMLALSVWWTLRPEIEEIDRATFEGHGGGTTGIRVSAT